jgi:hypothetical protein
MMPSLTKEREAAVRCTSVDLASWTIEVVAGPVTTATADPEVQLANLLDVVTRTGQVLAASAALDPERRKVTIRVAVEAEDDVRALRRAVALVLAAARYASLGPLAVASSSVDRSSGPKVLPGGGPLVLAPTLPLGNP